MTTQKTAAKAAPEKTTVTAEAPEPEPAEAPAPSPGDAAEAAGPEEAPEATLPPSSPTIEVKRVRTPGFGGANVREGKSAEATVIGSLGDGDRVLCIDAGDGWSAVLCGFVRSDLLAE